MISPKSLAIDLLQITTNPLSNVPGGRQLPQDLQKKSGCCMRRESTMRIIAWAASWLLIIDGAASFNDDQRRR